MNEINYTVYRDEVYDKISVTNFTVFFLWYFYGVPRIIIFWGKRNIYIRILIEISNSHPNKNKSKIKTSKIYHKIRWDGAFSFLTRAKSHEDKEFCFILESTFPRKSSKTDTMHLLDISISLYEIMSICHKINICHKMKLKNEVFQLHQSSHPAMINLI